jgi:hypothetical protein
VRDTIDTREALRLWLIWRNWREVAIRMCRDNGQAYTAEATRKAVWQYHRGER